MQTPASVIVNYTFTTFPNSLGCTDSAFYRNRITYMNKLEATAGPLAVVYILHCLFFYIAFSTKPHEWAKRDPGRNEHLSRDAYRHLHRHYAPDGMDETTFRTRYGNWRSKGSNYAFIARHVGLGSLVYLLEQLQQEKMWGASRGGERRHNDQASDKASSKAIAHLEQLGVRAQSDKSGVDARMHDCLWELCSRFGGFRARMGTVKFPGFN